MEDINCWHGSGGGNRNTLSSEAVQDTVPWKTSLGCVVVQGTVGIIGLELCGCLADSSIVDIILLKFCDLHFLGYEIGILTLVQADAIQWSFSGGLCSLGLSISFLIVGRSAEDKGSGVGNR